MSKQFSVDGPFRKAASLHWFYRTKRNLGPGPFKIIVREPNSFISSYGTVTEKQDKLTMSHLTIDTTYEYMTASTSLYVYVWILQDFIRHYIFKHRNIGIFAVLVATKISIRLA